MVPVRLWLWSHGRSSQGPVVRHRIWYLNPYRPSNAPCSGKTIFLYLWFGCRYPHIPHVRGAFFWLAKKSCKQPHCSTVNRLHLQISLPQRHLHDEVHQTSWLACLIPPSILQALVFSQVICGLFRKNWGVWKMRGFLWCAYFKTRCYMVFAWKKFTRILGFFLG